MKKTLLLSLYFIYTLPLIAQITEVKRTEIMFNTNPFGGFKATHFVVDPSGVFMLNRTDNISKRNWAVLHYSKQLELIKSTPLKLPGDFNLIAQVLNYDSTQLHFVFQQRDELNIATYNLLQGTFEQSLIAFKAASEIVHLVAFKDFYYFITQNIATTSLTILNIKTNKTTSLAVPNNGKDIRYKDVFCNVEEKIIAITFQLDKMDKTTHSRPLIMARYEENGLQIGEFVSITSKNETSLISADISYASKQDFLVSGAYSMNEFDKAHGVYITSYVNNIQAYIRFYNFISFPDFEQYVDIKRQNLTKKEITNYLKENNPKAFAFPFSSHKLSKTDDGYLFLTELFTRNYSDGKYNGNKYVHVLLLSLNKEGDLNWGKCLPVYFGGNQFNPENRILNISNNKNIRYAYAYRDSIICLKVDANQNITKTSFVIKPKYITDKINQLEDSKLSQWNGNTIWVSTEKVIKNTKVKEVKSNRYVYELIKLSIDD